MRAPELGPPDAFHHRSIGRIWRDFYPAAQAMATRKGRPIPRERLHWQHGRRWPIVGTMNYDHWEKVKKARSPQHG